MSHNSRRGVGCLQVVLGFLGICAVVGVAGGYYVYRNMSTWASQAGELVRAEGAKAVEQIGKKITEELDLTAEEKAAARAPLDELAQEIRANKIGMSEALKIGAALATGPVALSMLALAMEDEYIKESGLTPDQKQSGRATAHRFVRGILDRKIGQKQWEELQPLVTTEAKDPKSGQKKTVLKDKVTDSELSKIFEIMKRQSDAAGISTSPAPIALGRVIRETIASSRAGRATDDHLVGAGASAPVAAPHVGQASATPAPEQGSPGTFADAFGAVRAINLTLAEFGKQPAAPADPGAPPHQKHSARHAYFKAREVFGMLQDLRAARGLPRAALPPMPPGEPGAPHVSSLARTMLDSVGGLEAAFGPRRSAVSILAPASVDATDVFDALAETERRLAGMGTPAVTAADGFRLVLFVESVLERVRAKRNVTAKDPRVAPVTGKTPADCYQQARGLLADLAAAGQSPDAGVRIEGNRKGTVLDAHVLDVLTLAAADAAALHASCGAGALPPVPAREPGKTASDVFAHLGRARHLARGLIGK